MTEIINNKKGQSLNSAMNSAVRKHETDEWQSGVMGTCTNTHSHIKTHMLCSLIECLNVVTCIYTFDATKRERERDINQAQIILLKNRIFTHITGKMRMWNLTEGPIFLFQLSVTRNTQSP